MSPLKSNSTETVAYKMAYPGYFSGWILKELVTIIRAGT
jgi:hypothetical protein